MRLLDALVRVKPAARDLRRYSFSDWVNEYLLFQGHQYPLGFATTMGSDRAEPIGADFVGYVQGALKSNGIVSAVELVRLMVFAEARFQFQRIRNGRPGDLFGDRSLRLLERPWTGGTTGDLLTRILLDADLAGNSYTALIEDELVRLRPDWTEILLAPRLVPWGPRQETVTVGMRRAGYFYYEDGKVAARDKPAFFLPSEVAHFAPYPDPLATYRGMSWLTPVVREVQADTSATKHKLKFFENAAAQPYNARVLTPAGWTRMEDIAVGDQVTGPDGKPRTVLGVYPQDEKDIYRLTFAGGATAECCEDHVWRVSNAYDRKRGTYRTMTLREILDAGVTYPSGAAKWAVPLTDPIEYADPASLPLDPYLLGVLLGDGSFRSNGKGSGGDTLASGLRDVDEMQSLVRPFLPAGVTITRRDCANDVGRSSELYFRGRGGPKENPLTRAVKDLGLFNVHGRDKSIPEPYMRASISHRIALLQGLIDSDGHVNRSRACSTGVRFNSTSRTLAMQLRELVQSLGGVASCTPEERAGDPDRKPQWVVRFNQLPEWIVPARLTRKRSDYRPYNRRDGYRGRTLRNVELIGREPAQCIKVDAADGLYVTDDFIVTHNTPNLAVSLPKEITAEQFEAFVEKMDTTHKGVENAYRTLYTGGGADVTVIGADMRQLDFKVTQGAGETRVAAAGRVHPVLVGLSEGMQGSSLNAGNFNAARRSTADMTFRPLWRNVAGSLEVLFPPAADARLWVDTRDVGFLREDAKDAAEIEQIKAATIRQLVDGGFDPVSVIAAVEAQDMSLLVHSGLVSVQLNPPGVGSSNGRAALVKGGG